MLQHIVEQGQAEKAVGQAHKIKGTAANISPGAMQEIALSMETTGKTGDLWQLKILIPQLENRFSELKIMLSQ